MQFVRSGGRLSVWWFVECKNNFQKNLTKSFSPRAYSKIEIINDMRLNNMKNLLLKPYQQQLVCNRKAFCASKLFTLFRVFSFLRKKRKL